MTEEDYYINYLEIEEIPNLTLEKLKKPQTMKEAHSLVLLLDEMREPYIALRLANKLTELVGKSKKTDQINSSLFQKYQDEIVLLRFISLIKLPNQEIEELFRTKLIFVLRSGINVFNLIKNYIVIFDSAEIAVNFSNIVVKAMSHNDEVIGENKIFLESEERPVSPYLKNWLRNYNQNFKSGQAKGVLQESEYFASNKDVLRLSSKDRKIIEQVVKIYDFLRSPDKETEKVIPANVLPSRPMKPISVKSTEFLQGKPPELALKDNLSVSSEVLSAYQGDQKQQKAIAKEEEKIGSKFKDDVTKLREEFFKAVQNKNANRTVAVLRILAKKDDINKFLKEDEKLNKFLANVWAKQYGKGLVKQFKKNPNQIKFARLFLKYILQDRLEMPKSDAARIGLQIGNILVALGKKSYNKVAYFDVKSKEFKWF